jgi:hypothetical protein
MGYLSIIPLRALIAKEKRLACCMNLGTGMILPI